MPDDYQASLDYLFGRLNYERLGMPRGTAELRLGRMRRLLRKLGDPHLGMKIVHVAGTKGKGSTSAMIAAALTASGLKVGLFCSPHLHRLEERFRVDGVEATPAELVELVDAVRPAVDGLDAGGDRHYRLRGSTFFEVTAAMGLLHFARKGADVVVLEVGMGGRLDSTNVVRPALSVLTTISFDHTRQLGSTLGAIAGEKAGIIKRGRPAVSGVEGSEARAVIRRVAAERRAPLREIGADFSYTYVPPLPPLSGPSPGRVLVRTWARKWGPIDLPLLGPHQAHNAAVALASLDALAEQGIEAGPDAVARGFSGMTWPARVEVVSDRPWVVIDGAHNVASAEALAETLRVCFPPTYRTLVFGTTREKDLDGQLKALLPLADVVVATKYAENPRAVPPEEVARAVAAQDGPATHIAPGPAEALELARSLTPADGLILVTGSLFLAAESRALILGLAAPSASA
ncbi:bifunctional folylpolyglutamate synthase/dihydrofolate synthase [Tundrisphaera sp. TA3]|uniref:bifunctional folylpolyglutamate synthase/dihydrofolate synthase n=1 Tax=Tundrisphaera sp. TA3 TaxID=3435775 RepID=UPI003EBFEA77